MKILHISVILCIMHFVSLKVEASIYNGKLSDEEYLDYCNATGSQVCMNCITVGTCTKTGSTSFEVKARENCTEGETCYAPSGNDAACALVGPFASPQCKCKNGNSCEVDPNDNLSYVNCTDPITYGTCVAGYKFDLTNCVCSCPACGAYPKQGADCSSYFDCSTGISIEKQCQVNYCFNETDCNCYDGCPACGFLPDPDISSAYIYCKDGANIKGQCPGQIFYGETCNCITCPACGSFPDPNNSPSGYIYCQDGNTQKGHCPGQVFDNETCLCVSTTPSIHSSTSLTTTTSETTPTSTLEPCPACGYKSDPDNSPTGFIECKDGVNSKGQCPGQIFDSESCACMSCPACGFVPDPNNTPSGFIKCEDWSKGQCPGQIFDSATCSCVSPPDSSTTTAKTTAADPCSYCGYYAYPDDQTKYYKCAVSGDYLCSCPTGFYFDPTSCYCEQPTQTTTTTTTTNGNPCAYCGYFEYPGDTTKYYKCVGDVVTVDTCPNGFNFNTVSCYCE